MMRLAKMLYVLRTVGWYFRSQHLKSFDPGKDSVLSSKIQIYTK